MSPGEFLEYSELLSEGQGLDADGDGKADEDVAFISVPLKIEELGGVTRDTRNSIQQLATVNPFKRHGVLFKSLPKKVGKMVELDR